VRADAARGRDGGVRVRRWLPVPTVTPHELWQLLTAVLDILIVAYLIYLILTFIRGTRAVALLNGLLLLLAAAFVATHAGLTATAWLLQKAGVGLAVAVPVVFQPELRRALEQVGRGRLVGLLTRALPEEGPQSVSAVVAELRKAAAVLSRNRIGALVVLERSTGLGDIAETGIKIDGLLSAEFLINIFIPNTPLHDGAVIVRGSRVLAAACFLPLAESHALGADVGGRHRAAIGITEHCDAVAVVVSEETGAVSLANAGKLIRGIDLDTLSEMLEQLLQPAAGRSPVRGARASG
jgi:diadenylate cyclase